MCHDVQGINTATPTVVLPDGTQVQGSYEQSTGSHLIFSENLDDIELKAKTDTVLKVMCNDSSTAETAF